MGGLPRLPARLAPLQHALRLLYLGMLEGCGPAGSPASPGRSLRARARPARSPTREEGVGLPCLDGRPLPRPWGRAAARRKTSCDPGECAPACSPSFRHADAMRFDERTTTCQSHL